MTIVAMSGTICQCKFVARGQPMDQSECRIHDRAYKCEGDFPSDKCDCLDYRPTKPKPSPTAWPRCICGHIAQAHN